MVRSCFLSLLLVSTLLFFSFTHGFGRVLMETDQHSTDMAGEIAGKFRITLEVMDYADPEPNINPRNGFLSPPSSDNGPPPEP